MIFDEKIGIAFEGYNAELIRAFLILVHYTDLDTTQFDTGEGRQALYDILATHDMWPRNFEHTHSLQYQVLKTIQSILGTEDVTETIAKAESLNSKLIDMLGALQREQASPLKTGGLPMAKRSDH